MSFAGRLFGAAWRAPKAGLGFTHNFSFRSSFARSFHGYTKRAQIPKQSSKWTVYDELKLFSYTSHLAFFMLLPPVIQMYTTKVEVTRDDTLTESEFQSLPAHHGLVLRNVNFLDVLHEEKHRLIDMYLGGGESAQQPETISSQLETLGGKIQKQEKLPNDDDVTRFVEEKNQEDVKAICAEADPEFQLYVNQINIALKDIKMNVSKDEQSHSNPGIERVVRHLVKLREIRSNDKKIDHIERANNLVMKVLDKLHSMKLHSQEITLLRRLLVSYEDKEMKVLRIRQKLIPKYEYEKRKRSQKGKESSNVFVEANKSLPLNKMISSSHWLREYTSSFERFAQLVNVFAGAKVSTGTFHALFKLSLENDEVIGSLKDAHCKYSIVGMLDSFGQTKASQLLQTMIRGKLKERAE